MDGEITPVNGSTFKTEICTVTITCETHDATIYYTTNGRTPTARQCHQAGRRPAVDFAYADSRRKSIALT